MAKLIIMIGLPGSGKSTWAENYVLNHEAGSVVRVTRDMLRKMLDAGRFGGRKTEQFIEAVRDSIINQGLDAGKTVICDDTNLSPRVYAHIESLGKARKVLVERKDFTDVPLKTCIERDLARPNSVGHKVITDMYKKYLQPKAIYSPDPQLPPAIIVDVDGTIALMGNRNPYDYESVLNDQPAQTIIDIILAYHKSHHQPRIIVMSARDDSCKDDTMSWLVRNGITPDLLLMRATGDKRPDAIVKKEIFDKWIRDQYKVLCVFDDRNQVVEMWRDELGLTVLQVAPGDF